jgi:hypothetical protein|tara:strand:+ start:4770 stop:5177 length:408 start_codon:yes stop_codon:yes gene_type:complete
MMKKKFTLFIWALLFLGLISLAGAQSEIIDISSLRDVALPIHVFELLLALFICYMSLKFFRITKPISLFLYVYMAIGFFMINTALFLFFYLSLNTGLEMNFANVYMGSRVASIGMLISFVVFFYQWNKIMRSNNK